MLANVLGCPVLLTSLPFPVDSRVPRGASSGVGLRRTGPGTRPAAGCAHPSYGTSATGIQSAFIVIEQARGSGKEVGSQQERMTVQVTEPALFFSVALSLIRIPQ